LKLEKTIRKKGIHTNYTINYKNSSNYPKLYMGLKDQIKNGPFFGKDDISAVINVNFDEDNLYLEIRKRDNEQIEIGDNFNGDYNHLFFRVNANDKYYIKWGIRDNSIFLKSNFNPEPVIDYSEEENQLYYQIKIPWNKVQYFCNIPLKMNYEIYDYDENSKKKVVLSDNYVNLYFNQIEKEYLHLHNPLYIGPKNQNVRIDFELFLKEAISNNQEFKIVLNNKKKSEKFNLDGGVNNISLVIDENELMYKNSLTVEYGNLKDEIEFYYFSDPNNVLNEIGVLKKHLADKIEKSKIIFESYIDDKKYQFYSINKNFDIKKLNILFVSGTDEIIKFYKHNNIDVPNLLIYNLPPKINYMEYMDFIKYIKDKIKKEFKVNLIFWNIEKYRMFPYFLRYPVENRFNIYFFSEYDIYIQKDPKLQRNLQNYEITFLYNKFNRKYLYSSGFVNYKHVGYLDQIDLLNELEYETVHTYFDFIINNVKYNKVEDMEINQLQNYNARYFTCSIEKKQDVLYLYSTNIKLFSYPIKDEKAIYINDKKYNVFNNTLNYFYYNPEENLWNVFTKQTLVLPSIKSFFNGRISVLKGDEKTKKVWRELFDRPLGETNTDRIIYFGDNLPEKLANSFNIKIRDNGFYTDTGRFLNYDNSFITLFRKNNRYLLWFNYKTDRYFEYPFNYILISKKGKFIEGGGVIKR
jgi:hypothetical protein